MAYFNSKIFKILTKAALIRVLALLLLLSNPTMAASNFNFKNLQKIIKKHHPKSIEELLKLLPEEMKKNSVLIYSSQSSQFASDSYPRVLLYNKDADLVLAYSGDPNKAGFYDLETIQYNKKKGENEFRRISFDPKARNNPNISEVNPKLCINCHYRGSDFSTKSIKQGIRPNWDGYFIWKGVYGSIDDFATKNRISSLMTRPIDEEKSAYDLFYTINKTNPRYSQILDISTNRFNFLERPNAIFTQKLFSHNSNRIARHMTNSPLFSKIERLLAILFKEHYLYNETLKWEPAKAVKPNLLDRVFKYNLNYALAKESKEFKEFKKKYRDYFEEIISKAPPNIANFKSSMNQILLIEDLYLIDLTLGTHLTKGIDTINDFSLAFNHNDPARIHSIFNNSYKRFSGMLVDAINDLRPGFNDITDYNLPLTDSDIEKIKSDLGRKINFTFRECEIFLRHNSFQFFN